MDSTTAKALEQTQKLIIFGRVQGVFFRASMCREAHNLGVSGWVRINTDGTVEALLQGTLIAVNALITWAYQGPPGSHVEHIEITEAEGHFTTFAIRTRNTP